MKDICRMCLSTVMTEQYVKHFIWHGGTKVDLYIYSKLHFTVIKIANNGQYLSTKCDMTCTQTVSQYPAMQKQYLSSFCSHLYT